jgi:prepilin-type N-terminal cleavage/methylation domain-containing protein
MLREASMSDYKLDKAKFKGFRQRLTLRRGLTVVELLATVLILSVLMAIGVPIYLNSMLLADKEQCRAQMQAIVNAEKEYQLKDANHAYLNTVTGLTVGGAPIPTCPSGGVHTIDSTNPLRVKCDYRWGQADAHGTFTPNVDPY